MSTLLLNDSISKDQPACGGALHSCPGSPGSFRWRILCCEYPDTVALHWPSASSSTGVATRDTTAEVNTSFSEDLAGPYLLVWDLSSSRTGTVELRFTEVITLEVNLAKTLL